MILNVELAPVVDPPAGVNIEIVDNGDNVTIFWTNEGHTYRIYSNPEPYITLPDDSWTLENTVTDVGEITLPVTGDKKFHIVTVE